MDYVVSMQKYPELGVRVELSVTPVVAEFIAHSLPEWMRLRSELSALARAAYSADRIWLEEFQGEKPIKDPIATRGDLKDARTLVDWTKGEQGPNPKGGSHA